MLETVLSRVQVYSLLSDEGVVTEKEATAVKNIAGAILNVNELALMEQTAVFQRNNQFAKSVLISSSEIVGISSAFIFLLFSVINQFIIVTYF